MSCESNFYSGIPRLSQASELKFARREKGLPVDSGQWCVYNVSSGEAHTKLIATERGCADVATNTTGGRTVSTDLRSVHEDRASPHTDIDSG